MQRQVVCLLVKATILHQLDFEKLRILKESHYASIYDMDDVDITYFNELGKYTEADLIELSGLRLHIKLLQSNKHLVKEV